MIRVSDLEGVELDYWVARALGEECPWYPDALLLSIERKGQPGFDWISLTYALDPGDGLADEHAFSPSTDWNDCGPLIERYQMDIDAEDPAKMAWALHAESPQFDSDLRVAICRAVVASKYGEKFDPELLPAKQA